MFAIGKCTVGVIPPQFLNLVFPVGELKVIVDYEYGLRPCLLFECSKSATFDAGAAADAFAVVDLDCIHLARSCAGVAVRTF